MYRARTRATEALYFSSDPALLAGSGRGCAHGFAKRPRHRETVTERRSYRAPAHAAADSGADAISLVKHVRGPGGGRALPADPESGAGFGGLSGPAIKPIALRLVYEAAQAVRIPLIGIGGIATGEDAAEFLVAGAAVVEVGRPHFAIPTSPLRVARELEHFLRKENIASVGS